MLDNIETEDNRFTKGFLGSVSQTEQVADIHIAHLAAFGDTVGGAAIAASCAEETFTIDSQKLRDFWRWWVTEKLLTLNE